MSLRMRLIGYWKQSPFDDEYFPPQEFVGHLDAATREVLGKHLSTERFTKPTADSHIAVSAE